MMKKENFQKTEEEYIFDAQDIIISINQDIFDDETIEYADKIMGEYKNKKDEILNYMLDLELREFYSDYSDDQIKNNIGRAKISVLYKKDDMHPDWKFDYACIIDFCENKLDEHLVSIEFKDDFRLAKYIQLNG